MSQDSGGGSAPGVSDKPLLGRTSTPGALASSDPHGSSYDSRIDKLLEIAEKSRRVSQAFQSEVPDSSPTSVQASDAEAEWQRQPSVVDELESASDGQTPSPRADAEQDASQGVANSLPSKLTSRGESVELAVGESSDVDISELADELQPAGPGSSPAASERRVAQPQVAAPSAKRAGCWGGRPVSGKKGKAQVKGIASA